MALAVSLGMSGCGGGDGDGGSTTGSTAGATTVGIVTGFGSVFVNGVEWEKAPGASVRMDDRDASEDELRVGMRVTLRGRPDSDAGHGTYDSIDYRDELEGVVMSNSVSAADQTGSMVVMGQTVNVTALTTYEDHKGRCGSANVSDIPVDAVVEVSGSSSGKGVIEAARIECKAPGSAGYEMEVKGTVSGHDETAGTLMLGDLTVSYDTSTDTSDMPGGNWDGQYVEVKGSDISGVTLMATRIGLESQGDREHDGEAGEEYHLMGETTEPCGADYCVVDGQRVRITGDTEFGDDDHGDNNGMSMFNVGDIVKVEGYFNANGELVAREIERKGGYHDSAQKEFQGTVVDRVVSDPDSPNIGSVTIRAGNVDQVFKVDNNTIMEDDCGQCAQPFTNLSRLSAGDHVEIHAYMDSLGAQVARKMERKEPR